MNTETSVTNPTATTQPGAGPTAQAVDIPIDQQLLPNYPAEVRFAVVLYGGVSLAIYINGIVQELLRMVRATATRPDDNQQPDRPLLAAAALTGSEQVYRKLSYILAEGSATQTEAGQAQLAKVEKLLKADEPLLTRFVIDTISGTSAGGINGIFLAKALANDQKIDKLEELWVQEGDIHRLVNDRQSVEKPLARQRPPASLLNSQRMYLKLLNALDEMDSSAAGTGKERATARSPYVDELDLFVTATDLQGIPLPIRLADRVVYERRHRNVLHFVYSNQVGDAESGVRNDFVAAHNPFLAYAARCTSAFPFAFEPMQLADIDPVLNRLPQYRHADECKSSSEKWQQFFQDYTQSDAGLTVPFPKRAFGDGGYLDNKPFTDATETLARRHANVPVARKLIYVEPSPEHPEKEVERERKPNALENSLAALLQIPRYETIREDLERVMQRNRLLERVNRIIKGVEQDIDYTLTHVKSSQALGALDPDRRSHELWAKADLDDAEWAKLDLADMIKRNGKGYVAYHRLEIAAVTDDLADLVARVAGYDKESDYCLITRSLVRAWREQSYVEYRDPVKNSKETLNGFLHSFDLAYPMRRLIFMQSRIDRLHDLDQQVSVLIDRLYRLQNVPWPYPRVFQQYIRVGLEFQHDLDLGVLSAAFRQTLAAQGIRLTDNPVVTTVVPNERWRIEDNEIYFVSKADALYIYHCPVQATFAQDFRGELLRLKRALNQIYAELHQFDHALRSPAQAAAKNITPASTIHHLIAQLIQMINDRIVQISAAVPPDQQQAHEKRSPILDYFLGAPSRPSPVAKGQPAEAFNAAWAEADCDERARQFLAQNRPITQLFDQIGQALARQLRPMIEEADSRCRQELSRTSLPGDEGSGVYAARLSLHYYYQHYPAYDGIIFPMLYGTAAGEAAQVEILRISPEDASALIDEQATGCQKLAGTAFGHFGAFLQERWRRNDILWGRLDGAERIIRALAPQHPQVRQLIGEAQAAIVCETIAKMGEDERKASLSEALMRTKTGNADATTLTDFIQKLKENAYCPALKQQLDQQINEQELRDDYLKTFRARQQLDSEQALKTTARATTVIGEMLGDISAQYNLTNKYVLWIARIGSLLWGLVEVAVPRSIPNLLFRHWIGLGYLFDLVLLVGSILLVNPQVQHFALILLALTVSTHLAVLILGDLMRDRSTWLHIIKTVAVILGVVFVLWSVISLLAVTGIVDSWWSLVLMLRGWFAG